MQGFPPDCAWQQAETKPPVVIVEASLSPNVRIDSKCLLTFELRGAWQDFDRLVYLGEESLPDPSRTSRSASGKEAIYWRMQFYGIDQDGSVRPVKNPLGDIIRFDNASVPAAVFNGSAVVELRFKITRKALFGNITTALAMHLQFFNGRELLNSTRCIVAFKTNSNTNQAAAASYASKPRKQHHQPIPIHILKPEPMHYDTDDSNPVGNCMFPQSGGGGHFRDSGVSASIFASGPPRQPLPQQQLEIPVFPSGFVLPDNGRTSPMFTTTTTVQDSFFPSQQQQHYAGGGFDAFQSGFFKPDPGYPLSPQASPSDLQPSCFQTLSAPKSPQYPFSTDGQLSPQFVSPEHHGDSTPFPLIQLPSNRSEISWKEFECLFPFSLSPKDLNTLKLIIWDMQRDVPFDTLKAAILHGADFVFSLLNTPIKRAAFDRFQHQFGPFGTAMQKIAPLVAEKWFHGNSVASEVWEKHNRCCDRPGAFLVRYSSTPGQFALEYKCNASSAFSQCPLEIKRCNAILNEPAGVLLSGSGLEKHFETLADLVVHVEKAGLIRRGDCPEGSELHTLHQIMTQWGVLNKNSRNEEPIRPTDQSYDNFGFIAQVATRN